MVLLLSTYDMGRQPFGLASPVAWLREAGVEVACCDLSRQKLPVAEVEKATLALEAVQKALDGKPPRKVIVVPQRIVNVVA